MFGAIHKDAKEAQKIIMSRMLAAYGLAACTLVLRSAEDEKGRYHQRGERCPLAFPVRHMLLVDAFPDIFIVFMLLL